MSKYNYRFNKSTSVVKPEEHKEKQADSSLVEGVDYFKTTNNKTVSILKVPFFGEEQPLTLKETMYVMPTLKNGFRLMQVDNKPYQFTSAEEHDKDLRKLPNSVPTLFIDINVYARILYTVKRALSITGNECGGFFTYKKCQPNKPFYIATSQFLVGQEASSGSVELDTVDIEKYIDFYTKKYSEQFKKELAASGQTYSGNIWDYIGHWHSHGNMGTFWSSTDKAQQESIGQLAYNANGRFYLVFNKEGSIKASYVQYQPMFTRVDDINLGLYIKDPYTFTDEDKLNYDAIIEGVIQKFKYGA